MLAGLAAALMLLNVPMPFSDTRLPGAHGMLMTLGFVGTLICLERTVALGAIWGYAGPALLGAGGLLVLAPARISQLCFLGGTLMMVAIYVKLWQRQRDAAVLIQTWGAVFAVGAALMWLGETGMPVLVPWLIGFLVLTIAGERLELARLAMGHSAGTILLVLTTVLACGLVAAVLWPQAGYPFAGLALLIVAGWLAYHDVARRTIGTQGLTRFMAASMFAGYFWLVVAATVWMIHPSPMSGAGYDAALHAVFLGFTISMIFAHAPVIFPVIARRPLPYHWIFWLPWALLHASLVVRLWFGDAYGSVELRQVGGTLNVAALVIFALIVLARTTLKGRQ